MRRAASSKHCKSSLDVFTARFGNDLTTSLKKENAAARETRARRMINDDLDPDELDHSLRSDSSAACS